MTIKEKAEKAAMLKKSGACNCCQAVTAVLCDEESMDTVMKLASGFAVGMGNMEGTCGALVGAAMAAGLKTNGSGTVRYSKRIQELFVKRCGSSICKDLKGYGSDMPPVPCDRCVYEAVLAYGEIMGE